VSPHGLTAAARPGNNCRSTTNLLACTDMARSSAAARLPPTRAGLLSLALPLAPAALLRLALAAGNSGLTMDSALYVRMAEDLLAGHRGPSPAHHGYPALVALSSLVLPGREWPGRAISLVASLVLVAVAGWAARRRMPPALAWVPAMLVALHPLLAVYG